MNWTDGAVLAVVIASMYFGWKKGFIVAAIEFVKWIASIFIAKLFYMQFTETLISIFGNPLEKTGGHVSTYLYEMLGYDMTSPSALTPVQMNDALGSLKLPQEIEEKIRTGLAEKMVNTTSGFIDVASTHMSQMILYGLGFLLLIVLLISIFSIVQVIGNLVSKLPIINQLNQGSGLLLGLVIGVVSVFFIMTMLNYLVTFSWAGKTLAAVQESKYAIYFYKYNILQYIFNHILIKGQFS